MSQLVQAHSPKQISTVTRSTASEIETVWTDLHRRSVIENGREIAFRRGEMPTEAERERALTAITEVRRSLSSPVTIDEIEASVRLLSAGLKAPANVDVEALAEAYSMALVDCRSAALRKATRMLMSGKAEGYSKTFMPSAPELSELCQKIERTALAAASLTERLLALPEEREREVFSEEHCAAMRERIANLAKSMRAL